MREARGDRARGHGSPGSRVPRDPGYMPDVGAAGGARRWLASLPKAITDTLGPVEYFDVETRNGQVVLTPARIQRADAVRAKLAELRLQDSDIAAAVAWARRKR